MAAHERIREPPRPSRGISKGYSNWGHHTTAFDGGGQTGFYNVMLNDNDPAAAATWWEGSRAFLDAAASVLD